MTTRDEALAEIVDIARRHRLRAEDITAALADGSGPGPAARSTGMLARVLGYLGGILVLAGVALFIGLQWDTFSSAVRVLVTLGTGFALYLYALATMTDQRFQRVTTPLLLAAALLQPTGIVVMLNEYSRGGKPEHGLLFMCVVMFIQQFFTFLAHRDRSALLFLALLFGAAGFGTLCDILDIDGALVALVMGASLMCISYAVDRSIHKAITPAWYLAASLMFLYGAFDMIEGTPFELLFLGLACGLMYLATVVRSRTLLAVSVLALMAFTGYYFRGVLANAFGLIVMGFMLIGLSAFAMKLNRKYIQQGV